MELTPQQIDAARTAAEVARQARLATWPRRWDHHEKRALREHPPVRTTQPVPASIRQAEASMVNAAAPASPSPGGEGRGEGGCKCVRPPKRKHHVLP